MQNKSFEQLVEDYTRKVMSTRHKILDDFYLAYAAQLMGSKEDLSLDDICLVELLPQNVDGKMVAKYWFEYRPKFR